MSDHEYGIIADRDEINPPVLIGNEAEILVSLLRGKVTDDETSTVAQRLLTDFQNIPTILTQNRERLLAVPGMTLAAVQGLHAVALTSQAIAERRIIGRPLLENWHATVKFCKSHIGFKTRQTLLVLFLDERDRLIRAEILQSGSPGRLILYPREVVRRALDVGASKLVMAKNVPSGRLVPNAEEEEGLRKLEDALSVMEIELLDFILIGPRGESSWRDW